MKAFVPEERLGLLAEGQRKGYPTPSLPRRRSPEEREEWWLLSAGNKQAGKLGAPRGLEAVYLLAWEPTGLGTYLTNMT